MYSVQAINLGLQPVLHMPQSRRTTLVVQLTVAVVYCKRVACHRAARLPATLCPLVDVWAVWIDGVGQCLVEEEGGRAGEAGGADWRVGGRVGGGMLKQTTVGSAVAASAQ